MAKMELLETELPIVAAPMAGGPTTVSLSQAVASAGAFPFLAAGYKTTEVIASEIDAMRQHGAPFGVNLFVPSAPSIDEATFAGYASELAEDAERLGVTLDRVPRSDDDAWDDKLALLLEHPVPVVSFVFGLPPAAQISAIRRAGSVVLATVTSLDEAENSVAAGADGLIVQDSSAGGHSAVFDPANLPQPTSTTELVALIAANIRLPLFGAGGVDGADAVRRILEAGASGVVTGTMLLRSDEAGTSQTHRAALENPDFSQTVITRAFTGRPARALRNGFIDRHDAEAPSGYPEIHHLTRELRQAAARAGDADRVHLWAGTGFRSAPVGPAGDIIQGLASGA